MATKKQLRNKSGTEYETSPERVAAIRVTLDALFEESGGRTGDSFDDEESLRPLAQRLRVPYLAVLTSQLGFGGLTECDVEEYNAWRAMLGKAGKEAR